MAEGREVLGDPMGFAMRAVQEGLSARASLAEVRESGWAISNARWLGAMRNAQSALDLAGGLNNFARGEVLPPGAHAPWAAGTPGTYNYRVTVFAHDPATGITAHIPQMVASSVPLSPADVEQMIYDEWADPNNASFYDLQVIGTTLSGAYEMTGQDE